MKKKIFIYSFIFFMVDLISKLIFNKFLVLGRTYQILEKFFYITKTYNEGISFSMLSGQKVLIILTTLAIAVFLYFVMKRFKGNKRNILAFSLIYGGLIGNLLDRIIYGYVIDFFDFYVIGYNFPVFNFADIFIFFGVCLLFIAIYKGEDHENNSK